jgi:uncharacterized protein YgiM (DUF1202 family)
MTIHRLIQRAAFRTTMGLAVAGLAPVVCFAEVASNASATPQDEIAQTVETGKAQVPCVVNADAVVVRSGPGENYYPTMKLDKGAKVTVVGHKFGWLKVTPPEGSFSYIGKAFVTRNGDGTTGKVSANDVRVRAGSALNEMVSIVQAQLSNGAEVQIIGEKNEFFLIKPPAGAFVYINEKYLDPIPQGAEQPQVATNDQQNTGTGAAPAPMPGDTGATATQPPVENGTGTTPAPTGEQVAGGATTQPSPTGEQVAGAPTTQPNTLTADAQFDALEAEFKAMSDKPIEQQNVAELTASYQKLIASPELPESMKRIADYRVKMLGLRAQAKAEFAQAKEMQAEAAKRQQALKAEKEELEEQIKKTEVVVYAAVGTLQTSSLQNGTGGLLYRLTDPSTSRTIVYLRSDDSSKYGAMVGKFIGVKGEVTSESALQMKVVVPTDAKEIDPNTLYRTAAAQIVPPSMLPKTADVSQQSGTE